MRASRDVELIPDEELESLCAPTQWEQWLQRLGCVLGAALPVALVLVTCIHEENAGLSRPVAAALAGLIGALPGGLVFVYFLRLYGRRRDRSVVLDDRRLGRAASWEYVDEAREDLRAEGGPDWIVLLVAQALPMGDTHWVRVALASATGNVDVRTTAGETSGTQRGTLLPEETAEVARLAGLLAGRDPSAKRRRLDSPGIQDGFPVSLAVLRRSPRWDAAFDLNLAAVSDEGAAHPAVALVRLLLGVETRVAGSRHLAGFRDAGGDVRVAPV